MKSKALLITGIALVLTIIAYSVQAQRGNGRGRGDDHRNNGRGRYDRDDRYGRYDRGRNYGYSYSSPYRSYGYNYGYRPYYRPPVFSFSYPRVLIPFGGLNFYFSNGYYYRNWGGAYRVVMPPLGIRINVLPPGYRSYYYGNDPYYYYGGTYYRPYNNQFEVVEPPMGASVPELPAGAEVKVINGQKFYELKGTFYKEDIRDNSELWYTVVGKNGRLDTDYLNQPNNQYNNPSQSQPNPIQSQNLSQQSQYVIGDVVDKLPEDSRSIIINGQKLYLSPTGVYYQELIEKDVVRYKVVGK